MKSHVLLLLCFWLLNAGLGHAQEAVSLETMSAYTKEIKDDLEYVKKAFGKFAEATNGQSLSKVEAALDEFKSASKARLQKLRNKQPLNNDIWYLSAAINWMEVAVDIGDNELMEAKLFFTDPYSEKRRKDLKTKIDYKIGLAGEELDRSETYMVANLCFKPLTQNFCYASNLLIEEADNNFPGLRGAPMRGETNKFEVRDKPEGAIKGEIIVYPEEHDSLARFLYLRTPDLNTAYDMFYRVIYSVVSCGKEGSELRGHYRDIKGITATNYPEFFLVPIDDAVNGKYSVKVYLIPEDEKASTIQWLVWLEYRNKKRFW